jgi:hypothetical protein
MICVSVMLALFLGWPLAFGSREKGIEAPVRAEAVVRAVPAAAAAVAAQTKVAAKPSTPIAESCYKRFQRENRSCSGQGGAACRLDAADNWDRCEATGFWPE